MSNYQNRNNQELSIGTTDGEENEVNVDLTNIPSVSTAKKIKIGHAEGNKNKVSVSINNNKKEKTPRRGLLLAASIAIASLNGILANIVAAYLQDTYSLITEEVRAVIVFVAFLLTLAMSYWFAVKLNK